MRLNRRQVMQATLFGGLVGTFAGLAPDKARRAIATGTGTSTGTGTLDSYDILRNAVRFGKRVQLGSSARADTPADDSVLVTIKVMNHIHTPLCFALGQLSDDQTTVSYGGTRIAWEDRFQNPATLALLRAKGLELPSDNPRFRQLRLNKWWGDMLATGADESGAPPTALGAGDVAAFPGEADVAFQAVLGVSQTDLSLNHSFQNCALGKSTDMTRGGDIGYHVAKQGIITSPLGLVCLNMGDLVEITDSSGDVPNRVLTNDLVGVAALGRSVDTYTKVVAQAVGLGLVDEALVSKFDAFVKSDSTISDQLKNNRAALKSSLAALGTASAMETQLHAMTGVTAASNFQLIGGTPDQVARTEFLAQCKFVQQALEVPGKPFRNFTLLLNIADLNGAKLDTSAPAPGSVPAGPQPYSYIEGMRQLAIGLNLLAQLIKKHRNVYVAVVAEGGRLSALTDSKVSHSIVMGPGGAGNMKDFLYADAGAINSASDPYVADPNDGNDTLTGKGQKMPTESVVANESGGTIQDHITTGAVLNGLVRHLETKRGINATTTTGLGKFVRIQTA